MPRNSGADELVNVGRARELTIREFAETVMSAIGYRCAVVFGPSKLRGAPRKLVDVTRLNSVGWQPRVSLKAIEAMCEWFRGNALDATILPRALSTRVRIARSIKNRETLDHSVLFLISSVHSA